MDNVILINEIEDLYNILDDYYDKKLIFAFDWDNCISKYNGCQLPLRDKNSNLFFRNLNNEHIPWFVITARLGGQSVTKLSTYCIDKLVTDMHNAIPELNDMVYLENFNTGDIINIEHPSNDNGIEDAYSIIYKNIVFSGFNQRTPHFNKGVALTSYIIWGIIPHISDFDKLVFVDNDFRNIIDVTREFRKIGASDKLIAVYYPVTYDPDGNDKKCPKYNVMGSCVMQK